MVVQQQRQHELAGGNPYQNELQEHGEEGQRSAPQQVQDKLAERSQEGQQLQWQEQGEAQQQQASAQLELKGVQLQEREGPPQHQHRQQQEGEVFGAEATVFEQVNRVEGSSKGVCCDPEGHVQRSEEYSEDEQQEEFEVVEGHVHDPADTAVKPAQAVECVEAGSQEVARGIGGDGDNVLGGGSGGVTIAAVEALQEERQEGQQQEGEEGGTEQQQKEEQLALGEIGIPEVQGDAEEASAELLGEHMEAAPSVSSLLVTPRVGNMPLAPSLSDTAAAPFAVAGAVANTADAVVVTETNAAGAVAVDTGGAAGTDASVPAVPTFPQATDAGASQALDSVLSPTAASVPLSSLSQPETTTELLEAAAQATGDHGPELEPLFAPMAVEAEGEEAVALPLSAEPLLGAAQEAPVLKPLLPALAAAPAPAELLPIQPPEADDDACSAPAAAALPASTAGAVHEAASEPAAAAFSASTAGASPGVAPEEAKTGAFSALPPAPETVTVQPPPPAAATMPPAAAAAEMRRASIELLLSKVPNANVEAVRRASNALEDLAGILEMEAQSLDLDAPGEVQLDGPGGLEGDGVPAKILGEGSCSLEGRATLVGQGMGEAEDTAISYSSAEGSGDALSVPGEVATVAQMGVEGLVVTKGKGMFGGGEMDPSIWQPCASPQVEEVQQSASSIAAAAPVEEKAVVHKSEAEASSGVAATPLSQHSAASAASAIGAPEGKEHAGKGRGPLIRPGSAGIWGSGGASKDEASTHRRRSLPSSQELLTNPEAEAVLERFKLQCAEERQQLQQGSYQADSMGAASSSSSRRGSNEAVSQRLQKTQQSSLDRRSSRPSSSTDAGAPAGYEQSHLDGQQAEEEGGACVVPESSPAGLQDDKTEGGAVAGGPSETADQVRSRWSVTMYLR
jgi:hypothetical protein